MINKASGNTRTCTSTAPDFEDSYDGISNQQNNDELAFDIIIYANYFVLSSIQHVK